MLVHTPTQGCFEVSAGMEVEIENADASEVVGRIMILGDQEHRPGRTASGNALCTFIGILASTGAEVAARSHGMSGALILSLEIEFIRAVSDLELNGRAIAIQRGRTQQVWRIEIRADSEDHLVAVSRVRLVNFERSGVEGEGTIQLSELSETLIV